MYSKGWDLRNQEATTPVGMGAKCASASYAPSGLFRLWAKLSKRMKPKGVLFLTLRACHPSLSRPLKGFDRDARQGAEKLRPCLPLQRSNRPNYLILCGESFLGQLHKASSMLCCMGAGVHAGAAFTPCLAGLVRVGVAPPSYVRKMLTVVWALFKS